MKRDKNKDKSPRDKDPKNDKEQDQDEFFQPINTGLVTTDADEWKGVEMNNENKAFDEMNKQPANQINNKNKEDKEGKEEADDELNTHEQKKVTNKNRNIVNKPD